MSKSSLWLGAAAVALTLTGCVSSTEFKSVKAERDKLKSDLELSRLETTSYKTQLFRFASGESEKDATIVALSSQTAELQQQLDELSRRYDSQKSTTITLPPALVNELKSFTDSNKDLLDFDEQHGLVRFKSDMTFAVGSAELTPKAKSAIVKLASILSTSTTAPYELMVAGHTDSVKVSKPETLKKGHLDNWYLSSHRAISVGEELQRNKISSYRLAMVGYGDQRPVTSNATATGRAENRRVEVLILPTVAKDSPLRTASVKSTAAKKPTAVTSTPTTYDNNSK